MKIYQTFCRSSQNIAYLCKNKSPCLIKSAGHYILESDTDALFLVT